LILFKGQRIAPKASFTESRPEPDRAISACFRVAWTRKVAAMSGIFASLTLGDKRIRPDKTVIKGGIFPAEF
jgi:hypothetical protein